MTSWRSNWRKALRLVGLYGVVLLLTGFALVPFVWMLATSVKPSREIFSIPPRWITETPTLGHYRKVFFDSNIPEYFWNTVVVVSSTTAVALVIAVLAGYGFARFRFRGKGPWALFVLISKMLPQAVLLIPLYIYLNELQLIDTFAGLGLSYLIITLPLAIWLLRGFFAGIPPELEEAAMIDGCSRLGALFRIVVPISAPAIIASGVYIFTVAWQEFMYSLNFGTTSDTKVLSIGIVEFMGENVVDWGGVMAASTVVTLPVLIIFLAAHKYFIQGLTEGSVKG